MCTVTFMPRKGGYVLGMNRDERRSRKQGLPPALRRAGGDWVLCPSESGGGTWMAVNQHGASFALVNWYSVPAQVQLNPASRGAVVRAACVSATPEAAAKAIRALPLKRINPFRVVGFFNSTQTIVEWRWDLKQLDACSHAWEPRQWISSGHDEPAAQRVRGRIFREALDQQSRGSLGWLRRLHQSHRPEVGPLSICMHRAEAQTVSYTEVQVRAHRARMWHVQGPPCLKTQPVRRQLDLRPVGYGCSTNSVTAGKIANSSPALRAPSPIGCGEGWGEGQPVSLRQQNIQNRSSMTC